MQQFNHKLTFLVYAKSMAIYKPVLLVLSAIFLISCAGVAPLPGGADTVNNSFEGSEVDLKQRIHDLKEGMTRQDVFDYLERDEEHFILLRRDEILTALYGTADIPVSKTKIDGPLGDRDMLKTMEGYKLVFKSVKRKVGLSSPIAIRTNENGYSYCAILVFKDGVLYEKPILSGGIVDTSATKTVFDYLSVGSVMRKAGM